MNKTSPLARGIRTFVALLAAAAPTWVGVNLATDFQAGAIKIGLGVVAALLGGGVALVAAWRLTMPTTPIGKAIATFLEGIVAGIGTFTFAGLTFVEFERFGMVLVTVIGTSVTGALITLVTNAAEDTPATPA